MDDAGDESPASRAYRRGFRQKSRGPPIVEDWGSPHFDVIARRQGYWRPDPPIVVTIGESPGGRRSVAWAVGERNPAFCWSPISNVVISRQN
jgi:hypothetical protein